MKRFTLLLSGLVAPALVPATETKQPNILVIVADDMGWADVEYHGFPSKTPNINRW